MIDRKLRIFEAILIGGSFGGTKAVLTLLEGVHNKKHLPIVVCLHRPFQSGDNVSKIFSKKISGFVKEAEKGEKIKPGYIYFAPARFDLIIENDKSFSLVDPKKPTINIPSIDHLFESASNIYKEQLIGIILTGANKDGCIGIKKIKERGGLVIAENPKMAESPTMPMTAIIGAEVELILDLDQIKALISNF